jgi:hypothetical protein
MSFIRLWFSGYLHPGKPSRRCGEAGAQWGCRRALRGAECWHSCGTPALSPDGLQPSVPSGLAAIPTKTYYWSSLWLFLPSSSPGGCCWGRWPI